MIATEESGEIYLRASIKFVKTIDETVHFVVDNKTRKKLQSNNHTNILILKSYREMSNILAEDPGALKELMKKNYEKRKREGRLE